MQPEPEPSAWGQTGGRTLGAAESSFHGVLQGDIPSHISDEREGHPVGDTQRRMDSRKELERKKKSTKSRNSDFKKFRRSQSHS